MSIDNNKTGVYSTTQILSSTIFWKKKLSNQLGTQERPLRVAIIGSGPSGFYAAQALFKADIKTTVDMFDRLPVPYGLVRYGVAPDHPKIKNVIKVYEKTAAHPDYSFWGNVFVGKDISVPDMKKFYDEWFILYTK